MILTEYNFSNIVYESSEKDKKLYLKGVFLESEKKNRNGRTYKYSEIQEAVNKINTAAKEGHHILGALDHPPSLEVKLRDASHKLLEMRMDGNDGIGKAEIITTVPNGKIVEGLLKAGIKVGVSSRGSGTVNESTGLVEGFELITIDIVANPSANDAYPDSILEHMEYFQKRKEFLNVAEAVIHDPKAQKYFEEHLLAFISELGKK